MNNFDIAVESTTTALNSAGSAAKENAAAMDSIAMRIKTLQASFERLVNGQGGLNSFIKAMISSATAIIDFMNKIGGLKTAFTAMATTGIILAIANFEKLLKAAKMLKTEFVTLATFIPNQVVNALVTLDNATIGLATAEEVAAANAVLLKTAIGGVVAVLGIALIAWQNYTRAQEEAQQAAVDTAEAYSEEVNAIQDKIKEIEDETTSREKLQEVIKNQLGNAYDQEKEDLKDINELREEALRLLYEEAQTKARETQRTTGSQYDKQKDYLNSSMMTSWEYSAKGIENPNFFSDAYKVDNTPEQALKEMGEELDRLNQKRQQGIELTREEKAEEKDLSEAYKELEKDIGDAKTEVEAYEEAVATLAQTFEDWIAGNKDVSDSTNESANEMQRLGNIIKKYGYESYDDFAKAIENAGGSMDDFLDALEESSEAAEEYVNTHLNIIDSVEELNKAIAEEKEALATLQEIANQYNETGQMTADMVQTLATLSPQYVAALQNENGVLTVNTSLLQAQFEIQKELALINVEVAKQLAITAYCEQTLGEETSSTTTKLQEDEQQAYDLSSAYAQLTDAANRAAAAINRVRAEGKDDEAFYEGLREVQKTFDDMKDAIEQTEISTKDLSKAGKEVSKSHSSAAKKTEDAWKKAFDEEKKALDHMHEMNEISDEEYYNRLLELNEKYFGEASGQHEKYLDEYRKNEETAFKGLQKVYKDRLKKQTDAQLKALKQQKDAALKAIDAEIKGVKKAKDAALKAIDERIKAIKKQKDEAVKAIEAEIKALNKQKEAQHKYFQDKIDALQRAHDLQEQINQLEEYENQLAQAKAQRVWVMKDGQFQLGENEEAVNTAEQQLSDYKDDLDYERQLQELQDLQAYWDEYYDNLIEKKEEYKDYIEEYYDQQIEALEEYRDRVEEEYDAQIEALEEYRDQVEEMYDNMIEAYKEHVDAMLEAFDKFNEGNKEKYGTAIEDLRAFVAEWNGLIASMSSIDGAMSGVTGFMSSGMVSLKHHSGGAAEIGSYASGNGSSVKDDEIALVGESPNTEMLIGSKVNTGVVARLHKGSGVVNAESTKTLAGILNKLGKNKYIGNSSTEGSGVTQNFTFGSISLPNVTDANSFVEALRTTFGSYSVQYANAKA